MMKFFDAHAHTHFAAFENDWRETIDRALKNGVWMVNVGTQKDTSRKAIEVARQYKEGVYATVGLHPIHTSKSYHDNQELGGSAEAKGFTSRGEEFDYETYKKLARDPKVVAIGECGLDYYRLDEKTKERQQQVFLEHIKLAKEVRKPLMIHCREAFEDLIEILYTHSSLLNDPPGVIHFFTGTVEDAQKLLHLGFSFTFGGVVTFARDYDSAIEFLPLENIISETDSPYVAPVPYRGKRNEPAYVIEVVKKLAEIKGVRVEVCAEKIFENAKGTFSL